jgi:histidine triad (HIT) family protein
MTMKSCLFCKIINKEAEGYILFENEFVCCFLDKFPINKGHVLVVPKRHFVELTDVDTNSLKEIIIASQKIARVLEKELKTDGITIMQNNGKFKDVDHYHMHIFPRWEGDGFSWIEPNKQIEKDEFRMIQRMIKQGLCEDENISKL